MTRFIYPGGVRDHGLVERSTSGAAWEARRVTFDDWKIDACPEHGPALSISGSGRYHMSWFSLGELHKGLFYAYSSDQGRHFSSPKAFGGINALPGHPSVLAKDNQVSVAWQEYDGTRTVIKYMHSLDQGENWSLPEQVSETRGNADIPILLSNGDSIYLSWNTEDEGYRLVPLK